VALLRGIALALFLDGDLRNLFLELQADIDEPTFIPLSAREGDNLVCR
jgi:sulfate adenylyltransferase subunit 1 (EFTu-like GTPase family)